MCLSKKDKCSSLNPDITIWSIYYFNPINIRENEQFRRKVIKIIKSLGVISFNFEELTAFMVVRAHFCSEKEEETQSKKSKLQVLEKIQSALKSQVEIAYNEYLDRIISKFLDEIRKNKELKETSNIIAKNLLLNSETKEKFLSELYQSIESRSQIYSDVIRKSLFFANSIPSEDYSQIILKNKTIQVRSKKSIANILDELILFNFALEYGIKTQIISKDLLKSLQQINKHLKKIKEKTAELDSLLDLLKGKSFEVLDNIYDLRRQIARQNRAEREIKDELKDIGSKELEEYVDNSSPKSAIQEIVNRTDKTISAFDQWFESLRKIELIDEFSLEITLPENFNTHICNLFVVMELLRIWSEFFYDVSYFTVKKGKVFEPTAIEVKESIETSAVLVVEEVYKTYKLPKSSVYALRGVSFEIHKGEFIAIMGPSGAGKTTLVNILTGLDSPDKGVVYLNGQNIALMDDTELTVFRRDQIGLIFQFYQLFPELTAVENVSMPAEMAGMPVHEAREKAQHILEVVDLGMFAKQFPDKLSGGQQQRVAIARALVNDPSIVVADQLTGDLDSVTGMQIIKYLRKINEESGVTILLVTHNKAVATQADRILTIEDGELIEEIDMVKLREVS
jgi:putative ABC transport system ATP-binding protein